MRYLATHEHAPRGTFDFPIELYYVDPSHPRYLLTVRGLGYRLERGDRP